MMNFVQLVDDVTDDLEANVSLPDHYTFRYVEPRGLASDRTPALAVYPPTVTPNVMLTTDVVDEDVTLRVDWAEDMSVGADSFAQDQERAKLALGRARSLLDRLYVHIDGLPSFPRVMLDVDRVDLGRPSGTIWRARYVLTTGEIR